MVHRKRLQQQGKPQAAEAPATSQPAKREKSRLSESLSQLILRLFETDLPRKGLSLVALKKSLAEAGYNVSRNNGRLKREIHALVSNGLLVRVTGSGVSGTFKPGRGLKVSKKLSKSEKCQAKRLAVAKKVSAKTGEPKKKPRKKQQAVNKTKGFPNRVSAAGADRKRQLRKC